MIFFASSPAGNSESVWCQPFSPDATEGEEAFLAGGMLPHCSAAKKVSFGAKGQERECSLD